MPAELRRLLYAIHIALCDIENYSDYEPYAWGDMLLYEEADGQAIVAYEELLMGILSPEEVEERSRKLAAALREHREELPG